MRILDNHKGSICRKVILRLTFIGLTVALWGQPSHLLAAPQTQQPDVEVPGPQDADVVLNLQQAVDIALDESFGIFQLQNQFLQVAYILESSRRGLRTQVNLSSQGLPNISQRINARLLGVPADLYYLKSKSSGGDLNLSVYQPLITDGRLSFNTGFFGSQEINDIPVQGGGLGTARNRSIQPYAGIGFSQPLFQYNQIRGQLRSNELSVDSQRLRYTEDELRQINEVTRSFYDLFQQQRRVEIAADNYRQSGINYQTGLRMYNSAQQSEVQVFRLRVDMANALSDLESDKTLLERRRFAFNRTVGMPLETTVWVESTLEYEPIEVDVERALQLALQNRSDVRRQELQLEQNQLTLKERISEGRPDLRFSASYSLTGNSTLSELGYDDTWSEHLRAALDSENRSPFTNISMTLSVPILDGGVNDSYVERQLTVIRQQERQIEEIRANLQVDVINRVRAVEGAMRLMEILEENLQIARTSYRISQQQYERGEITLEALLLAQNQRRDTERRHLEALISFEMAKADLKEITLWDWETDQPVSQRTTFPVPFGK